MDLFCDRFFTIVYDHTTRGHSLKLFVPSTRVNCRQHFFDVRVIDVWNSLHEDVVAAQQFVAKLLEPDDRMRGVCVRAIRIVRPPCLSSAKCQFINDVRHALW